jgi:hypothetical protein
MNLIESANSKLDKLDQVFVEKKYTNYEQEAEEDAEKYWDKEDAKQDKWGFDLTDISSENWKKVLKVAGAKEQSKLIENDSITSWEWKGKDVVIYTGNDPITGKFARGSSNRQDEIGYASYIGIEGNKDMVSKVANAITKLASEIKDESPHRRSFI